ncbi:RagB/SusD family nutrient uptake outer membrane protein [Chitinophaga sp. sic0106]|uniref:RagB/SusD family nutrient uptake outer membrane protein n=1 Tax=Chitinophaga sp. sic0106 TaxID=2854785 RepID=UPI001C4919C6|nr:RagB/SusD family nutrient uptake outer membrane protein [Chitinophaga sp. sic0106]MBV7530664.1 RagB/SusD family nutrient uptake outer membrane protein [Chitinophaga sp. sic0106]
MRSSIYLLAMAIFLLAVGGCKKYTDITPKGQNLLNRATDLDLLLNVNYSGTPFTAMKQALLDNDMYLQAINVPNTISSNVQTMNKILLTYDESADRAALTLTDGPYEGLYRLISTVANIVLANADKASGDPQLLKQLKAEAHILRAYSHYLLVNIYAKAYDPASAAMDGGVPYVKDIDFESVNNKNTVKEVYDNLLGDVDAALAMDALPDQPKNGMRIGKAFAYAVKAKVLLSMRNYPAALEAVKEALKYNSTLEDHRTLLAMPKAARVPVRSGISAADNLFYATDNSFSPTTFTPTYEILRDWYEPGNIIKDSSLVYNYDIGYLYVGLANIPGWIAPAYESNMAGMTTSDLVLMKAECLIRTNQVAEGMAEVNSIRIRRISPYIPLSATDEAQGMKYLQQTSRIEFLYTMRNFINLKRWNREGKYAAVITRTLNGVTYQLTPDSKLWIFPFPQSATQFNASLTQNY